MHLWSLRGAPTVLLGVASDDPKHLHRESEGVSILKGAASAPVGVPARVTYNDHARTRAVPNGARAVPIGWPVGNLWTTLWASCG